jgi:hypothetical protein
VNRGHASFQAGSEVVLFYEHKLGLYPRTHAEQVSGSGGRKWRIGRQEHGGIPQVVISN